MFWMHPSFPWPEGKYSEPWWNLCVCCLNRWQHHRDTCIRQFMWGSDPTYECIFNEFMLLKLTWFVMEITVIRLSCIPEEKPGRPLSSVDTVLSLVLRRDGRVRYGMMGYVAWCFLSVGWSIYIVMLILQEMFEPPESTVDWVMCQ